MKKKAIKKLPPLAKLRKQADRLWQIALVEANPHCLLCGAQSQVGHHFIHKATSNRLRYDIKNGIPLCNRCHARLHTQNDPRDVLAIVDRLGSAWYDYIQKARQELVRPNRAWYEQHINNLT